MLVSLTVGKVDAGVTVLLTPDKRLIEFPSILLPPSISSGSIVDIAVSRNSHSESLAESSFRNLQSEIFSLFGTATPLPPVLRCRNATQTSVVLEWDPISLATSDLLSLSLYRNNQKAGSIPRPVHMHSTKISGLAVDTEYTFHLVLRTSAGTHSSNHITIKTHKMSNLSGITITAGILPASTRDSLTHAVERIGAKIVDGVRIDTTHFVTTEGRGLAWEKAVEMNIPVVRPEWVDACERNGRILGVTKFYLDAMRGPTEFDGGSGGGGGGGAAGAAADKHVSIPASQTEEKNLPPAPQGEDGGASSSQQEEGQDGDQEMDEKEMMKKEQGGGDDVSSSSSSESGDGDDAGDDEPEQKAQVPVPDEQKVRLEEKDVPLRLASLEPSDPVHHDDEESEEGEKKGEGSQKAEEGGSSSGGKKAGGGDGSSFQDVAL
ncbi:Chitin synthase class 5 [Zalerion maritima]|uniref:Chitin synthase class 5 n=1 Tax=Zalerion maritima TaxID=339359 RepID=A0AAD5RR89_9PEZI|nr:Chitin synthase class 5 [Zalerion maritima]